MSEALTQFAGHVKHLPSVAPPKQFPAVHVKATVADVQVATFVVLSHGEQSSVAATRKYPLAHVAHFVPSFILQAVQFAEVQETHSVAAVFETKPVLQVIDSAPPAAFSQKLALFTVPAQAVVQ